MGRRGSFLLFPFLPLSLFLSFLYLLPSKTTWIMGETRRGGSSGCGVSHREVSPCPPCCSRREFLSSSLGNYTRSSAGARCFHAADELARSPPSFSFLRLAQTPPPRSHHASAAVGGGGGRGRLVSPGSLAGINVPSESYPAKSCSPRGNVARCDSAGW